MPGQLVMALAGRGACISSGTIAPLRACRVPRGASAFGAPRRGTAVHYSNLASGLPEPELQRPMRQPRAPAANAEQQPALQRPVRRDDPTGSLLALGQDDADDADEGVDDAEDPDMAEIIDSLQGMDPQQGAQVLEVIDGLLQLSDEELTKVWGSAMQEEYGESDPQQLDGQLNSMLEQLNTVQASDESEQQSPQAMKEALNSLLDQLHSVHSLLSDSRGSPSQQQEEGSGDERKPAGGAAFDLAADGEAAGASGRGAGLAGSLSGGESEDAVSVWRSASDMLLATLLVSSYSCYLQRPLLAPGSPSQGQAAASSSSSGSGSGSGGSGAVAGARSGNGGSFAASPHSPSQGPEGGDGVEGVDASERLWAAPFALIYLDCSQPGMPVVEYCNAAALRVWDVEGDNLLALPASAILAPPAGDDGSSPEQVLEQWTSRVLSKEPHHLSVPSMHIRRSSGAPLHATDVLLFRVNSIGGEGLGIGVQIPQWQ